MKAANRALAVPRVPPVRAPDGKFQQGKGDRLVEAHRKTQDAKPKAP